MSKREVREAAQEMLMADGIANVLGYWYEKHPTLTSDLGVTEEEFRAELQKQADRVARLLGYEAAWGN